jgi:hypothetical protein
MLHRAGSAIGWVTLTKTKNFHFQLLNNLFGTAPNGLDILAIHIQRGRDHGLPGELDHFTLKNSFRLIKGCNRAPKYIFIAVSDK